jgi:hypothetical protein
VTLDGAILFAIGVFLFYLFLVYVTRWGYMAALRLSVYLGKRKQALEEVHHEAKR